jgi:predicted O-methyltransferase YrrM
MSNRLHIAQQFLIHYFSATRKGHRVHSPFAYSLCEEVFYNTEPFYQFQELEAIRKGLLSDERVISVTDLGAGSRTMKSDTRKISDIAAKGISSPSQSAILYRLCNFLNVKSCLELGTSLGLNTLYLAKAGSDIKVVTIEGSEALSQYASQMAKKKGAGNISFITGEFSQKLPEVLRNIPALDLGYIDGNHRYAATMEYFSMFLEKKHDNTVMIFDDIHWSPGMTKAWNEIKSHPQVTLTIDTFYSGYVFFRKEVKEKVHLRILV